MFSIKYKIDDEWTEYKQISNIQKISEFEYILIPDFTGIKACEFMIETKGSIVKNQGNKTTESDEILYEKKYDFNRPITLGMGSMVFMDPNPDDKNIYGHIDPLVEIDTLRVTVPLAIDPDKWGDVEILSGLFVTLNPFPSP